MSSMDGCKLHVRFDNERGEARKKQHEGTYSPL